MYICIFLDAAWACHKSDYHCHCNSERCILIVVKIQQFQVLFWFISIINISEHKISTLAWLIMNLMNNFFCKKNLNMLKVNEKASQWLSPSLFGLKLKISFNCVAGLTYSVLVYNVL